MKKIFLALISLIMAFSLYAQNSKSVGLSDSDVKNWAKNCVSIQKEFEKIGIDTNDSFTVAVSEKQKAESILQKYGISNPNSIEKYSMILQCAAILKAESELDEQSKAMMKLMKVDPLGDLKKNINSKDYNVVASNSKAVLKAFSDLDEYDSSSTDARNSSRYCPYISTGLSSSLIKPCSQNCSLRKTDPPGTFARPPQALRPA